MTGPLRQNVQMPHSRQRDLGCSVKAAKQMNQQTAKTLEDIEHAVKAVHSALACNRGRVSRMTSVGPSGEVSPASTCCSSGSITPQQRSLAAARLVAKQARAEPAKMDSDALRSMDSLGVSMRSLDCLGVSVRSLSEARAARKEEVCAEKRNEQYVGSLLEKLDDMQRIVVTRGH